MKRPILMLPLSVLFAASLLSAPAQAQSSAAGEEFLSNAEAAPPNIIFLIDLSTAMSDDCAERGDSADTASTLSGSTCLEDVLDAIDQLTQHYDWAYYGIIGTTDSASADNFLPIAPIGASHAEIAAALSSVTSSGTDVRNLSEALAATFTYMGREAASDSCPSYAQSSLIPGQDFCNVPLTWACQETHIITITAQYPAEDESPSVASSSGSLSTDVMCDINGISTTQDLSCLYDNTAHYLYNNDARSDLSGTQNIVTHTIALRVNGSSIAESLYGNTADQIGNDGVYTVANSGDEILGAITLVMSYIRSGFYSRSAPTVSADGEMIIYSFYEIDGGDPLAEGHVRAYSIDSDPLSPAYGEVQYTGPSQFGGAVWDAGDLLVSRPVVTSESNPDDRDGLGQRDIYTFVEEMMDLPAEAVAQEGLNYRRMGFDYEFVEAVANNASTHLPYFLDDADANSDGCADDLAWDFTKDGCLVDADDMQSMVDFVRGMPSSTYRYMDMTRGYWKLGDSPHSVPVVVGGRTNRYAMDNSYRNYLQNLESSEIPDMVFIAANDGMLHAFRLYDDLNTTAASTALGSTEDADEGGEEMWAWIPAYTIYKDRLEDWSGGLADMLWYGRTFLFDGSPVWEDVWIDGYTDGVIDNVRASDGSEWRRVLVVQQGKGGPVTLALDITDPLDPRFLWEQTNRTDTSAMGYTVSRPVIANIYNAEASSSSDYTDTYVAMWGSGRAVPESTSTAYYSSSEPSIYLWHIADDYWGTSTIAYSDLGDSEAPESATMSLDMDGDGRDEYGYISGALAAVDADSDGDVDVLYFPVTASYEPTDMSDPDGDGLTGLADISDPGFTWMYKAIISSANPDDMTWCEFYDPNDTIGVRPEVYYAATTSWHFDGSLGVYWGSGTPYDRDSTETGWFFAMKDPAPLQCGAATPIDGCGSLGAYELDAGEGLTGDPLVYAGTVYFSTYVPAADRCTSGEGRIYGLGFEDCADRMDTDGDGVGDAAFISVDGYPSSVSVSDNGTLYYGTSNPDTSGSSAIGEISAMGDPYLGTKTLGLREVF